MCVELMKKAFLTCIVITVNTHIYPGNELKIPHVHNLCLIQSLSFKMVIYQGVSGNMGISVFRNEVCGCNPHKPGVKESLN